MEAVWCVLGLAGLAVWWRLLKRLPAEAAGVVPCERYGAGDAVLAGLLGLWFVFVIMAAGTEPGPVTGEMILIASTYYATLVFVLVAFLIYRDRNPVVLFGLKPRDWRRCLVVGTVGLAAIYPVVGVAQWVSITWLFPEAGGDRTVEFLMGTASAGDRWAVALLAVVVAPVAEEVIFRGFLYGVVRKYGGRLAAIGVTTLLFAAIHLNFSGLLPLAILAVALALAFELTGSLWTSIYMHMIFNGVTLARIFLFPESVS